MRGPRALWKHHVVDVQRAADRAATVGTDRRLVIIVLTVAGCLLAIRFFGTARHAGWLVHLLDAVGLDGWAATLRDALTRSARARIHGRIYWAMFRLVAYVVVPVAVIRLVLRERVGDFGVRVRGAASHWRIYALLLVLIAPCVVVASYGSAFQAKYPFYRLQPGEALWPWLWAWEALYAMQFAALEFFFRGFMVHGLAPRMGYAAVLAMVVPYMMIHFGKPLPEAAGSIVAGLVLGTLALQTRSIWWGVMVHVAVAVSMDLLSLWHRGLL